jgi:hypothetical protein
MLLSWLQSNENPRKRQYLWLGINFPLWGQQSRMWTLIPKQREGVWQKSSNLRKRGEVSPSYTHQRSLKGLVKTLHVPKHAQQNLSWHLRHGWLPHHQTLLGKD